MSLEETQLAISEMIRGDKPFMVGRLGSTELRAILRHRVTKEKKLLGRNLALITIGSPPVPFRLLHRKLAFDSGFYPVTPRALDKFSELMMDSMRQVDLLGSWVEGESYFADELAHTKVTDLGNLEPFWSDNPWTQSLEGLRVLVVHPFAESISRQYASHQGEIFARSELLPAFGLQTMKAVQSLGGPDPRFTTWFDALDWMTDEALDARFDVAIVGCGAYGFPLSARLKQSGSKVIHLGGFTQILFGIRGRRWDADPRFARLFNDYWVRPAPHEVPYNAVNLGQNSYW